MFKDKLRKIKPIEIFVFIFTFSLLVFAIKFYTFKPEYRIIRVEIVKQNWIENYNPLGYKAPFWLASRLEIGQSEKNHSGQIIAEIIDLENYEKNTEEIELFLNLKIQVAHNPRDNSFSFKGRPVTIGSPIELYFNNTTLVGQVIDDQVPESGYPHKDILVTLRGRQINPAVYSKIVPGIEVSNLGTNEVIAKVISVSQEPSTLTSAKLDQYRQELLFSTNPKQRDIVIVAQIKVQQLAGQWFYAGRQKVKLSANQDHKLWLYTKDITLYDLEIEDIKELPQK
jgi:hypothetical protein